MSADSKHKSKDRGIWLVGGTLTEITGSKLPSNRQVLARFFHVHLNEKETVQQSATKTARELLQFWAKARIPTQKDYNIIVKIKELHCRWQAIKKNAGRRTESQTRNEDTFCETLDDLFDVAHANALTTIKIDEDRQFLQAQREKGRRGCMGSVDKKLTQLEDRRSRRELQQEQRKQQEEQRKRDFAAAGKTSYDTDSGDGVSSSDSDTATLGTTPSGKKRCRMVNIMTPELASALDRTKVSDRNATYILSAAAKSFGYDPCNVTLNKESVRLSRRQHREEITSEIRKTFLPETPLTVHWDGKLLPSLTGHENVDRLAVIVSGDGIMKLLAVPQLASGTGDAQATAVYAALDDWNLINQVNFMGFDTTASNTGIKTGACVLLEQKMEKQLVALACRHHIHELVAAKVFETLIESSTSGPQIKLFQRFASAWSAINCGAFESGTSDKDLASHLNPIRGSMLTFLKNQLLTYQPRDDYRELLNLAILFLGDTEVSTTIHAPGAYHRARWMAKLIYCFKIYLFRSQFKLTAKELSGLKQFNLFITSVYLQAWYSCPSAASAPRQDLDMLHKLVEYKQINERVANAALNTFGRHLWYINEITVGLAFFDDDVSVETKVLMVNALMHDGRDETCKRISITDAEIVSKQLPDFVSTRTKKLFTALGIPEDFIHHHPSEWNTIDSYKQGRNTVLKLKVVNDAAERGISLIQSFNSVLTNQEEQKQYLLQVVEKHRLDYPDTKKSTLMGMGNSADM